MSEIVRVGIPVEEATAAARADESRLMAVGKLIDSIVRAGPDHPLTLLLAATAADAQAAGVEDHEVAAALAAYHAERRG